MTPAVVAELDRRLTVKVPVKAGTHTLWATTVLKSHASRDDMIKPFLRTTVDGLTPSFVATSTSMSGSPGRR